jgi:hypothetical protein
MSLFFNCFVGAVYYYTQVGGIWSRQSKLIPDDGAFLDYFGRAVTIYNTDAFIGSFYDDDRGDKSGIVSK